MKKQSNSDVYVSILDKGGHDRLVPIKLNKN